MFPFSKKQTGQQTISEIPDEDYSTQSYGSYPMPYPMTSDKADLLDKIRPEEFVETIMHRLMGEERVNGEWKKLPSLQPRAISFRGAWDIANLMLSVSSQNVSLSKLNDVEIRNRTLEIVKQVQRMCLKNWKEYRIHGVDQLGYVHEIVMSNTFITLKQPEGEGIRNLIKGVRSETVGYSNNLAEGKGFLGGIFRR